MVVVSLSSCFLKPVVIDVDSLLDSGPASLPYLHLRSLFTQRVVGSMPCSAESLIPVSEPRSISRRPLQLSFALVLRLCPCLCSSMSSFLVLSSAASSPMFWSFD